VAPRAGSLPQPDLEPLAGQLDGHLPRPAVAGRGGLAVREDREVDGLLDGGGREVTPAEPLGCGDEAVERERGGDALDPELVQRPAHAPDRLLPAGAV